MESNIEKPSLEGQALTLAFSRPGIFPFERLPAELRVKVYEYALISPCGWFNITWKNSMVRNRISVTEDLSRTELLGQMCIFMICLNKSIHQEACKVLYGSNLFHFDFPLEVGVDFWVEDPHYEHNVVAFLSSISKTSRGFIRSIRIYAATQRLERASTGDGWLSICRYLASKVQLTHFTLVIVNNCTFAEHDIVDMRTLCKIENPWVRHLITIKGLKSFNLHTARCPYRDTPFEARARCPTTLPLARGVVLAFNKTHEWTAEDRTNGLVIKNVDGRREFSKNTMTRHLERHHFNPFYGEPLGVCISQGFKKQLRTALGIESSAHMAEV